MACLLLFVFPLSFLQMTWAWYSLYHSQVRFSSLFLPPGPGQLSGIYQQVITYCRASSCNFPVFIPPNASNSKPTVGCIGERVIQIDTAFASSVHCRDAANTARRLLFMVWYSFSDLSRAFFTLLYWARLTARNGSEFLAFDS